MLEEVGRTLFGCFCHQDPSLLLRIDGQLVQLCPRCIGLHIGFAVSFIVGSFLFMRGLVLSRTRTRLLPVAAVASLAFDWVVGGRLGLYAPSASVRLLTGLACGSALAIFLIAYRTSLWTISVTGGRGTAPSPVAGVMLAAVATGSLVVQVSGWVLLTALCIVAVLTNVVLVADTAARMVRVRMRLARCVPLRDASYLEGGAG